MVVSPVHCEIPTAPGTHPGDPALPRMWTKFSKGLLVGVGGGIKMLCCWKAGGGGPRGRGREQEEGRAGAWRIGCPTAGASEEGGEGDAPATGFRVGQGPRLQGCKTQCATWTRRDLEGAV